MSEILVIQTLPKKSSIPADAVQLQWVFHYGAGAPDATAFDDIADNLFEFWDATPSGASAAPRNYLSPSLATGTNVSDLAYYDITSFLDGSPHGSPVAHRSIDLDISAGDAGLPDEVCTVLTYHRPYATDVEFDGSIRPRARDRGRLYIGPLRTTVTTTDSTTKEPFIVNACLDTFTGAAAGLAAHTTTTRWAQWSRADASIGLVSDWWMDNAFDTQRRRGNKATNRVTGSV